MKTLDELGISPTPWNNRSDRIYPSVDDAQGFEVAELSDNDLKNSNARLIAAAPDCYDALHRIVRATEGAVMDFPKWQKDLQKAIDDAKKAIEKAGGGNE